MRIQESLVTDKQIALELYSENGRYRLPIEGKDYYFPTVEKVHEAFLNQNTYDTIKLTHGGKKSYLHLFMDEIEVFDTKKALRQRLSQDSQGMWAEIRNGQKHYYKEERGWTSTSYKEITEQECIEKLEHTSTMTKALGIGLGILALLPGAVEFARHLPIGTKEAAMGLIALNQKNPVLGALGYSLLPSKVEAQALGTEFQVNTYTTGDQSYPSVAPLNDGGFIVTWASTSSLSLWSTMTLTGQDGDGSGIFAQRYDSNGVAAGPEFQVNTYTTLDQYSPKVAPLNDGGFVIAWESNEQFGDGAGIYAKRYDRNGTVASTEFQVNTYTTSDQQYPSIAPLNDGGFVVTWSSNEQDRDLGGIYAQRYDSSGVAAGAEFQVNTYSANNQIFSRIASLNNGGFVITWQSDGQDGDSYGIYAQRYDSNGVAAGPEFLVNTYTTDIQGSVNIAPLNNGGFVITWTSNEQDGDLTGIFGKRFSSTGVAIGAEFQINTYTTGIQSSSSVAPLNDGGFIVLWESDGQDGNAYGIYAQRYDSSGVASGSEFQVNTYTTSIQLNPTVAPLNDGGFVVIWGSSTYIRSAWWSTSTIPTGQDGDGSGIFGQRYDASGNPIALQLPTSTIVTPTPSPTPSSPSQNTPTPSFVTPQSTLTLPTNAPSNAPSPTQIVITNLPAPSTVASMGPSTSTTATTSKQTTIASSTTRLSNTPSSLPISTRTTLTTTTPPVPNSNTQTTFRSQSIQGATSSSRSTIAISSTPSIISVENIVYEETYPIFVNDEAVGTFTVSGGTGLLDSGNSNVIYFEFDPSFQPEEGEVITLFTIPEEEVALWESMEIKGESYECLEARGQVATNQGRSSYQMVFEDTECVAIAPKMLATALPLTLN